MAEKSNLPTVDNGEEKVQSTPPQKCNTDSQQFEAATKLWNTTEMLESILYYLPANEIIHARGVSRHFRAVIDGSHKLKRAAFLQDGGIPVLDIGKHLSVNRLLSSDIVPKRADIQKEPPPDTQHHAWQFDRRTSSIKPMLSSTYDSIRGRSVVVRNKPLWFEHLYDLSGPIKDRPLLVFVVALNPTFPIRSVDCGQPSLCHSCRIGREIAHHFYYECDLDASFLSKRLPADNAIFWDTYITQPAVAAVTLKVFFNWSTCNPYATIEVYRSKGVKMRDIYRGLRAMGLKLRYGEVGKNRMGVERVKIGFEYAAAMPARDIQAVEKHADGMQCTGTGSGSDPGDKRMFWEKCNDLAQDSEM